MSGFFSCFKSVIYQSVQQVTSCCNGTQVYQYSRQYAQSDGYFMEYWLGSWVVWSDVEHVGFNMGVVDDVMADDIYYFSNYRHNSK